MGAYPFPSPEGWMVRLVGESGEELEVAGPFDDELAALEMARRSEALWS